MKLFVTLRMTIDLFELLLQQLFRSKEISND